jgi:hypothetical protein
MELIQNKTGLAGEVENRSQSHPIVLESERKERNQKNTGWKALGRHFCGQ